MGGGLTKNGVGTLLLDGANTFSGTTTVNAGTLAGNGSIAGPLVFSSGATLSAGDAAIGILSVNNKVSLAAGSTAVMKLNKTSLTNDSMVGVTSLTYGGTLVLTNLNGMLAAGDTFRLFSAAAYSGAFSSVVSETPGQTVTWDTSKLVVNGSVKVASAAVAPVSITPVLSTGNLNLSWPASQTGSQLQVQTNSLSVGISTNWVIVPGSTATNQASFPINRAAGSVFFRLVLP
jgi:autotransporter-associated beta strand protein